jgi:hypothetical protein
MSTKLNSLVQAVDDPEIDLYVLQTLGVNVPPGISEVSLMTSSGIASIRNGIIRRYQEPVPLHMRLRPDFPVWMEKRRQVEQLLGIGKLRNQKELLQAQKKLLEALLEKFLRQKPEDLRPHLTDRNPTIRFLTIQVIARRRLPLERALIERLVDRDPAVIQAARAALVRLGRGVDFGPAAIATRTQRHKAVERWTEWLALQEKTSLPAGQHRRSGVAQAEMLPRPSSEPEAGPRLSLRGKQDGSGGLQ